MLFAFALSAFAQQIPKKPEAIPPSEATAPAESNIPAPEQKPTPAVNPESNTKVSKEKRQIRRTPKTSTAKKDTSEKK